MVLPKNQKDIIENFLETLEKRQGKGQISYGYNIRNNREGVYSYLGLSKLDNLIIKKGNNSIVLNLHEIDNRFLQLAKIGSVIISFDRSVINEAGEWNIVNQNSSYIITKTLSSFLNNKVWAWLERSREIWGEELFPR